MYFRAPDYSNMKEHDFVCDVFMNGFGGGMHSLLFQRIREQLGLCYGIYCYLLDGTVSSSAIVQSMLDRKDVLQTVSEVTNTLDQVAEKGFDERLLKTAKNNILFDIAKAISTPYGFAKGFCDKYFSYGLFDYGIIKNKIDKITNDDIVRYANWMKEGGCQTIRMNER